jgi:hypothetical protein
VSSPAKELADYIDDAGIAVLRSTDANVWSLAYGMEPDAPSNVVTIYDNGGGDYFADIDLSEPHVQVRVRGLDYDAAYAKQVEIKKLFTVAKERTIGANYYIGIWMISDILPIGSDTNNRFMLTANYRIERQALNVESTA